MFMTSPRSDLQKNNDVTSLKVTRASLSLCLSLSLPLLCLSFVMLESRSKLRTMVYNMHAYV